MSLDLYHYTCLDGAEGIRRDRLVKPLALLVPKSATLPPWSALVWFTDLNTPERDALGLTSHTLNCDRTSYRFTATPDAPLMRWVRVHHQFQWATKLESQPGSMPMHWFVSWRPTPVEVQP